MAILEVCTASMQSVRAVVSGGARRLELCDNLAEGGTTPSCGFLREVLATVEIPVHVLVRPRSGDFLYDEAERRIMLEDIRHCRLLGAAGVVIGALQADGRIDRDLTLDLIGAADGMQVTFHRAIDLVENIFREAEWLARTPVSRVLTSGQAASALQGEEVIRRLIAGFGSDLTFMPGGGLTAENIAGFHQRVAAAEYHATLRSPVASAMTFRRGGVSMGTPDSDEYRMLTTDPVKVATFVQLIR